MIGHQREVLSALGIDLWIPRAAPCQQRRPTVLWRDHTDSEIILPLQPMPSVDVVVDACAVVPTVKMAEPVANTDSTKFVAKNTDHPAQQLAGFQLQSLSLSHCIILLDATSLTADQHILWANIQRAATAEFSELNWPFAWQHAQDARGAHSYIAGFVDGQGMDKPILMLGEVPHFQHSKAMQLPSLQEMLEQPLLKRRLWQLMQNKHDT